MIRKDDAQPMTLEDIEEILVLAGQLSNHRRFVIAGSLCVIGAVMRPPVLMTMSRDLDMYPQLDPGRGFVEIATHLGEGSEFHRAHGFYVDPITPNLLVLPQGWEARLAPIAFKSGVVGFFMDPNDAALGKLVRAHVNDIQWLIAGLREGILNAETIQHRLKTVFSLTLEEVAEARSMLQSISEANGEYGEQAQFLTRDRP